MAGLIPQSFINDLIDRADIVDVVGSRITLKKVVRTIRVYVPSMDEKSPSFFGQPRQTVFSLLWLPRER